MTLLSLCKAPSALQTKSYHLSTEYYYKRCSEGIICKAFAVGLGGGTILPLGNVLYYFVQSQDNKYLLAVSLTIRAKRAQG